MTMIENANLIAASEDDQAALGKLGQALTHTNGHQTKAKIVTADGQEIEIPAELTSILQQMGEHLAKGQVVSIVPNSKELSSEEAAEIIRVPHRYFLTLLERGEIPHTTSGTQHCVRFDDLMRYKAAEYARMKAGVAEIARISQEIGEKYY